MNFYQVETGEVLREVSSTSTERKYISIRYYISAHIRCKQKSCPGWCDKRLLINNSLFHYFLCFPSLVATWTPNPMSLLPQVCLDSASTGCLFTVVLWTYLAIWIWAGWLPPALCPTQTLVWPLSQGQWLSPQADTRSNQFKRLERGHPGPRARAGHPPVWSLNLMGVSKDVWACWPEGRPQPGSF